MARGLAGAALFAVPVAVAAAIGFGTSLSGVAGGLSAVTNGPDAVPVSAQTGPKGLNDAVAALTKRPSATQGSSGGDSSGGSGGNTGTGTTRGGSGGTGDTTGTNGTSGGSTGTGGNTGVSLPTISTPTTPSVPLPGGSTGDTTNQIDSTVNNVLGGVGNTVNGLLGK
jgi:hypothetical protein